MSPVAPPRYEVVDFRRTQPVECPCGQARRAFADVADFPATIHVTEISIDAKTHYHRQFDGDLLLPQVRAGSPDGARWRVSTSAARDEHFDSAGKRHGGVGKMRVLIVVFPKFDPADEWFD